MDVLDGVMIGFIVASTLYAITLFAKGTSKKEIRIKNQYQTGRIEPPIRPNPPTCIVGAIEFPDLHKEIKELEIELAKTKVLKKMQDKKEQLKNEIEAVGIDEDNQSKLADVVSAGDLVMNKAIGLRYYINRISGDRKSFTIKPFDHSGNDIKLNNHALNNRYIKTKVGK